MPGRSQPRSTARQRELERMAARQRRRQTLFTSRLGSASEPRDRLLLAVDLVRGAVSDVPAGVADREIDRLVTVLVEAVARLHRAGLTNPPRSP